MPTPPAPAELRRALGHFPTGVTIVTCVDACGRPQGMTANSFASVSLDPPLVLWSVAKSSRGCSAFVQAHAFAIHVLGEGQQGLSSRFAQAGADKFEGVAVLTGDSGVPLIPGCLVTFECRAWARHDAGDHVTLVGRVVSMCSQPLDGQGNERGPLAFHRGRYTDLIGPLDLGQDHARIERAKQWMGMEPMSWS